MNEPARRSAVPEPPDRSTLRSADATEPAVNASPVAEESLAEDRLDLPIARAVPKVTRGAATPRRLGIHTPRQALLYLPFRYDDFSDLRPLGDLVADEKQSEELRLTDGKFNLAI